MLQFFRNILDFIVSIVILLFHLLQSLLNFILMIPDMINSLLQMSIVLPAYVSIFFVAGISLTVVLFMLNKNEY